MLGLVLLIAASIGQVAQAQPFSGTYSFGTTGINNPFIYNGTQIANLTVGALARTNLTAAASSSGNFRSAGCALDPVVGSLTGTVDTNKYFEFSLTAAPGYSFNITNLNFGFGRSGTGPRTLQWRSSADGFAAAITNYSSLGSSGLFSNNNGVVTFLTDSSATNGTGIQLGLVSPQFQSITAVTFRCYLFNAEATNGSGGLQGPFTFSGTMIQPVGPLVTWTGDGTTGTWEAGQPGKFGAAYTNDLATDVTFAGTGDVVTVNGNIQAGALNFNAPGYELNGGSIELGFGSISVTSGLATINSAIGGDADLSKTGPGRLKLGGANTFTGNVIVSEGTLEISGDANLGAPGNDLSLNGTLKTVGDVTLGAGRDLSGNVVFDIPPGATLTISGSVSFVSTTINGGTLDLRGPVSSLGTIILNGAATIRAPAGVNATQIDAPGLTNGMATIDAHITFPLGTRTVNVPTGGVLILEGAMHNNTNAGFLVKTGEGILHLKGANFLQTLRIGDADYPPTPGGTVVIYTNTVGRNPSAVQLNAGTLRAATNLTGANAITNGIQIGGRSGALAIIEGENIEFTGISRFFTGTGTSNELRLAVNNTTRFNMFTNTTGGGDWTGITIGGTGTVVMAGNGSAMLDEITLRDSLHFHFEGGTMGGGLNVGANNVLGGEGTILGSLEFAAGAKLVFNPTNTIFVMGPAVTFADFGVEDLIGLNSSTVNGVYKIIDGLATINTNNLSNHTYFSPGYGVNAYYLGAGKYAYFTVGSLELNVVSSEAQFSESAVTVAEPAVSQVVTGRVIITLPYLDVSGQMALSGSATPGADYDISALSFSMSGSATTFTFKITITNDFTAEPAETIVMTLTNLTDAFAGTDALPGTPSIFTITINDDDVFTPPPLPENPSAGAITLTGGQANVTMTAVTGLYYYLLYPTVSLAQISIDPINLTQWGVADSEAPATNSPVALQDPDASTQTGRVYGVLIRSEAISP